MKNDVKATEGESSDFDKKILENLFQTLGSGIKASSVAGINLSSDECGMDDFLVVKASRIKIANLDDLFSFHRISSDTLIHKSNKELWSIKKDDKSGDVYIERHFNADSGEPLKV